MADNCADLVFDGYKDSLAALGYKDKRSWSNFTKKYRDIIDKAGIEKALEAAGKEMKRLKVDAAAKRRNAVFNASTLEAEKSRLERRWKHDPYKGLIALLNGTAKDKDSIFNAQRGLAANWFSGLEHDLFSAGFRPGVLQKMFRDDAAFDLAVSEARVLLNEGGDVSHLPKDAVKVSEIFKKWDDVSRETYNMHGGRIGRLDSRGQPIDHNPSKIRFATKELSKNGIKVDVSKTFDGNYRAWKEYMLDNIDHELTFDEFAYLKDTAPDEYAKKVDAFMSSAFEAIITDVSLSHGGANEGTRLAHSKVFHFKDARAGAEYNRIFGHSTQLDAYARLIERRARSAALMERLGPDARRNLDELWDFAKKLTKGDIENRVKFRTKNALMRIYAQIDGSANVGGQSVAARIFGSLRAFQNMTRLWGVTITSQTDLGYRGRDAALAGVPMMRRWASYLDTFRRINRVDRSRMLSAFGIANTVRTGDYARRWGGETIDGKLGRMSHIHANLNLLTHMTDAGRLSHDAMLAGWLYEHRVVDFDNLPDPIRADMDKHDINAKEWDVIVETAEDSVDDMKFFSPDKVAEADLGLFKHLVDTEGMEEAVANRALGKARASLVRKLRTWYVDHAYSAVIEPDAQVRSWFALGMEKGALPREAFQTMLQFWQFPLQVLNGPFRTALDSSNPMVNLSKLILTTAFWGFVALNIGSLLKGRKPRVPEDAADYARMFGESVVKGGGAGVWGDFIWNVALDEHGRSVSDVLTGPTAQDLTELIGTGRMAVSGEPGDAGKRLANQALKHFPNTFYTKLVWELYIAAMIRETIEPGWQDDIEDRIKTYSGEEPMMPAYERVPRGGLAAVGE